MFHQQRDRALIPRDRARAGRRRIAGGFVISLCFHLAVLLAFVFVVPPEPEPEDLPPPSAVSMVFNGGRPEGPAEPDSESSTVTQSGPKAEAQPSAGEVTPDEPSPGLTATARPEPPPAQITPDPPSLPPPESAPTVEALAEPPVPPAPHPEEPPAPPPEPPLIVETPSPPVVAEPPPDVPSAAEIPPPIAEHPAETLTIPLPPPEPPRELPPAPKPPAPSPPRVARPTPPAPKNESWPPARVPRPAQPPSDFPAPQDFSYGGAPPAGRKGGLALGLGRRGPADTTPFSLDTDAEVGPDWRNALSAWVEDHAYYPSQAAALGQQGSTRVMVTALPDGRVTGVELDKRSGSPWLDLALQALFRGAKLPPFPKQAGDQPISFRFTMHYILVGAPRGLGSP